MARRSVPGWCAVCGEAAWNSEVAQRTRPSHLYGTSVEDALPASPGPPGDRGTLQNGTGDLGRPHPGADAEDVLDGDADGGHRRDRRALARRGNGWRVDRLPVP